MTPLRSTRRHAEAFADAVDGRGSAGPGTDSLVRIVGTLRAQEPVLTRDEFAADLRARLMLEAQTALTPQTAVLTLPPRARGTRERRLVAAATALVFVGGTAGMAAAAQEALPGEALYPIKRGLEAAQAGLSLSDSGRGQDLLDQATDRLTEVDRLLEAEATDAALEQGRITETLQEFTRSAREGAGVLFDSYRETRDPADIVTVRTFVADGMGRLEALTAAVPTSSQQALAAGAMALRDLDVAAQELCPGCSDLPDLALTGALLTSAEVSEALRRAEGWTGSNDHPVVVDRAWLARDQADARSAPGGGSEKGSSGDAGTPPEGGTGPVPDTAPGTGGDPGGWPSIVPDLGDLGLPGVGTKGGSGDGGTKGGTKGGGSTGGSEEGSGSGKKKPGGVVGEVTEPLGDAVETLLPDLGGDDGLLP